MGSSAKFVKTLSRPSIPYDDLLLLLIHLIHYPVLGVLKAHMKRAKTSPWTFQLFSIIRVGLENFSFTFDGNNPFAVKKSIEANLTIKAANFSELLRVRNVKGYSFRYIDLALKTGKSIKEKTGNKELDFRIKAVVGVAEPNGETTANFSSIAQAVKNNYVTLSLTPVTHTFDFDEVGGVVFKVEYRAYIEEYFDKARMNIFAQPEINKSVIERRLAIKTQKKTTV